MATGLRFSVRANRCSRDVLDSRPRPTGMLSPHELSIWRGDLVGAPEMEWEIVHGKSFVVIAQFVHMFDAECIALMWNECDPDGSYRVRRPIK